MSNFEFERFGIAGFGPMGQLMSEHMLPENVQRTIFDPRIGNGTREEDLAWNDNDAVLFSVPGSDFDGAIKRFKQNMPHDMTDFEDPLIIENMSVKQYPEWIVKGRLPNHPEVLHCHPLFGPETTVNGVEGKLVIVTSHRGEKSEAMLELWSEKGLEIEFMAAEEHDRLMAKIHASTFALGRIANKAGIDVAVDEICTPSSKIAAALAKLDAKHTQALFETILGFNDFFRKNELPLLEQGLAQVRRASSVGQLSIMAAKHMAGVLELGGEKV